MPDVNRRELEVATTLPGGVRIPDLRWPLKEPDRTRVALARIEDAIVTPTWLVVDRQGVVPVGVNDLQRPFREPIFANRAQKDYPDLVVAGPHLGIVRAVEPQETVEEPVFLPFHKLVQWNWFGHWIIDTMPRLAMAATRPELADHLFLVPGIDRRYQRETLQLFGIPVERLRVKRPQQTLRCRQLAALDFGTWPPMDILRSASRRFDLPEVSAAPLVYLSRRKVDARRIENEQEVEALLEKRGFRIIHPQDLSLGEQIALMKGAKVVVAASGSAATLVTFCEPGTKMLLLYTINDPVQTGEFFRTLELSLWAVSCIDLTWAGTIAERRFQVPVERMLDAVDDMIAAGDLD